MRNTISLTAWVRAHRDELRRRIRSRVPNIGGLSEEALRLWVLNDESLYLQAKEDGVSL